MLVLLGGVLAWLPALLGYGLAWARPTALALDGAATRLLVGLCTLQAVAHAVHLVAPLDGVAASLAWAVGVGLLGWRRADAAWAWRGQPTGGVAIALVIAAVAAASEPSVVDAGLYHQQVHAWTREFAAIPGLVHLHERFAFTHAPLVAAPLLELPGVAPHGAALHGALVTCVALLVGLRAVLRAATRDGDTPVHVLTAWTLLLAAKEIHADTVSSGTADAFAAVLVVVTCAWAADLARSPPSADALGVLAVLAAGAVSTKASAAPVVLLCVALAPAAARAGVLARIAGPLGVLWLPWILHSRAVSGCAFFPSDTWCADALATTATAETRARAAADITQWARWGSEGVGTSWVPRVLRRTLGSTTVVTIAVLAAGAALGGTWARVRRGWTRAPASTPVVITGLVAVLAWFMAAPDPRFVYGWFVVLAGQVVWAAVPAQAWQEPRVRWTPAVAGGLLVVLALVPATSRVAGWLQPAELRTAVVRERETLSGYRYAVPVEAGGACWATPLPCVHPNNAGMFDGLESGSRPSGFVPARP